MDIVNEKDDKKKEISLLAIRKKADIKKLLKQVEFRRFIWELLNKECLLYSAWNVCETEAIHILEGRRMVGLEIRKKILDIEPIFLERMASEEASERNSRKENKKN